MDLIKEGELCSQGDRLRRSVVITEEPGVARTLSETVERLDSNAAHFYHHAAANNSKQQSAEACHSAHGCILLAGQFNTYQAR